MTLNFFVRQMKKVITQNFVRHLLHSEQAGGRGKSKITQLILRITRRGYAKLLLQQQIPNMNNYM